METQAGEAGATPPNSGVVAADRPDFDWDGLLRAIGRGSVIPIIGPELLPYHRELASAFATVLGVAPHVAQEGVVAVADEHARLGRGTNDLRKLEMLLEKQEQAVPETIGLLAKIEEFKLFVTTDYSNLIERALQAHKRPYKSCAFDLSRVDELQEYPRNEAVVYHLLGQFSELAFALPRVAQLDWLLQLQRRDSGLVDVLKQRRNLLFLGCDFPEWISGFFLRTLLGRSLQDVDRGMELIASRGAPPPASALTMFLRANRVQIFEGDAEAFVKELVRRYQPPAATKDPRLESLRASRGRAFVSYRRSDGEAVQSFVRQLREKQVEVWFDETDLEPGDRFANEIKVAIQEDCSAFIPIVSRATLEADKGFFIKEWNWAVEAASSRMQDVDFVFPVIIDETSNEEARQTLTRRFPAFTEFDFVNYVAGNVGDLANRLLRARKRFERNLMGREVRP
jgi:hypothetical protein